MQIGRVEVRVAAGVRRNDGEDSVTENNVWLISSTGEVMTVVMVVRLVERAP